MARAAGGVGSRESLSVFEEDSVERFFMIRRDILRTDGAAQAQRRRRRYQKVTCKSRKRVSATSFSPCRPIFSRGERPRGGSRAREAVTAALRSSRNASTSERGGYCFLSSAKAGEGNSWRATTPSIRERSGTSFRRHIDRLPIALTRAAAVACDCETGLRDRRVLFTAPPRHSLTFVLNHSNKGHLEELGHWAARLRDTDLALPEVTHAHVPERGRRVHELLELEERQGGTREPDRSRVRIR